MCIINVHLEEIFRHIFFFSFARRRRGSLLLPFPSLLPSPLPLRLFRDDHQTFFELSCVYAECQHTTSRRPESF